MFSATMRRLSALAGGIGLSLIVANSANAAVVPITSGSHTFSPCTQSLNPFEGCGGFFFVDTISFNLLTQTTIVFTLTDTSTGLQSDYDLFGWGLFGPDSDLPIFGSGFGSPLSPGGVTLDAGSYALGIGGTVNNFPTGRFGIAHGTNGASYNYEIDALTTEVAQTPIPAAALLFGSGLAVLGFTGRSRKKKTAA
jgi:hypothetical protein